MKVLLAALVFDSHVAVSGGLWRPPAVPAGPGPLGGARRGELRSDRLHRGEQTQRLHPHRRLHPLDRGNADQGLLPALMFTFHIVRKCWQNSAIRICAIKLVQNKMIFQMFAFFFIFSFVHMGFMLKHKLHVC